MESKTSEGGSMNTGVWRVRRMQLKLTCLSLMEGERLRGYPHSVLKSYHTAIYPPQGGSREARLLLRHPWSLPLQGTQCRSRVEGRGSKHRTENRGTPV